MKMQTAEEVAPIGAASSQQPLNGRIIGIRHRIKKKKDESASPTLVTIRETDGTVQSFKLETEQEELDFLNGQCPVKWRVPDHMEDISGTPEHQIKFRAAKDEDILVTRHISQCHHEKKRQKGGILIETLTEVATHVPTEWIGVRPADAVAMILGGSGDYYASALSRKLSTMGGVLLRIPAFKLKAARGESSKDDDAKLLATLAAEHRDLFYITQVRDRGIIHLRNQYRGRMEAMKARIGCEQRLFQRHIGDTFCSEEGHFPEGSLIKAFQALKIKDEIHQALTAEEEKAEKALERAVYALDVWEKVFEPIPGVGPMIAARLINSIVDIRRFEKASQLVKFLGVHVILKDKDGKDVPKNRQFPRRRSSEVASWHPDGRQALYLLSDQFNRQAKKGTKWGDYLIKTKLRLRERHPAVVEEGGKKRYTDAHIHKMAIWRTLTRFAEHLHREWWKLEKSVAQTSSKE
jgi:hypothetical protein